MPKPYTSQEQIAFLAITTSFKELYKNKIMLEEMQFLHPVAYLLYNRKAKRFFKRNARCKETVHSIDATGCTKNYAKSV